MVIFLTQSSSEYFFLLETNNYLLGIFEKDLDFQRESFRDTRSKKRYLDSDDNEERTVRKIKE